MAYELWSIQISPWSLRTKWSLRHFRVLFKAIEYKLPLSEWMLRWKLRQWKVSVPVLFGNGATIQDSTAIVKYAQDFKAPDTSDLIIDGVEEWKDVAETIMSMERYVDRMSGAFA
jgi:hypothetical protein